MFIGIKIAKNIPKGSQIYSKLSKYKINQMLFSVLRWLYMYMFCSNSDCMRKQAGILMQCCLKSALLQLFIKGVQKT